jgi:hypothetical protein
MRARNTLVLPLILCGVVEADEVARKPSDYPVQATIGFVIIAAENLGPSVPTPSGGLFTSDYIAIEVAVYPQQGPKQATITHQEFALRINGAKVPLPPDSAGAVAASIKYPDWEERRRIEATAGVGGADVILGRPRAVERFPGDQRPVEQQGRVNGRVPPVENPVGKKTEDTPIEELVRRAALPEGDSLLPISGCLFFRYKGKLKSIKKLELLYTGSLGEASLRIL